MTDMQQIIDKAIELNAERNTALRDAAKFHISDAGTCYRKRFLKRLGVEATSIIPTPNLRKMVAGDAGHEKLQYLLKRARALFAAEGEVSTDHIKGHFDGIVRQGKQKILIEFKTIEKYQMPYIRKDGPREEHLAQMFSYWYFVRADYSNLNEAILSYVKREDFEAKDFHYSWEDKIGGLVEAEWKPLIKFWKEQTLPPCTCEGDYNGNGIKYCRYIGEDKKTCCAESLFSNLAKVNPLNNKEVVNAQV